MRTSSGGAPRGQGASGEGSLVGRGHQQTLSKAEACQPQNREWPEDLDLQARAPGFQEAVPVLCGKGKSKDLSSGLLRGTGGELQRRNQTNQGSPSTMSLAQTPNLKARATFRGRVAGLGERVPTRDHAFWEEHGTVGIPATSETARTPWKLPEAHLLLSRVGVGRDGDAGVPQ